MTIRAARPDDAGAISAIYAPYVAETPASFELDPPDAAEMSARMARLARDYPWVVWEEDGAVIGYASAGPHADRAAYRWSAHSSVYIHRRAHRRGIGRALYGSLHAVLRAQGFHSVFGGITLPNAASVGLHEACGYVPVGVYREVGFKFGAWHDVGWWGLALNSAAPNPAPPLPLSDGLFERAVAEMSR